MHFGAYGRSHSSLPTESSSGHSADDNAIDLSPGAHPPPPQVTYFEDGTPYMNHQLQENPLNARDHQIEVNEEPYRSSHYPPTGHTPIRGNGRNGIPHPEDLIDGIYEQGSPVTHPPGAAQLATALPVPTQSAHSYMPPTAVGPTGVNIPREWPHQGMTTNAPFDMSSQTTRMDTTTNSSAHAAVPSGSSRGPVTSGTGRGPTSRYSCNICGRSYSQSQGLRRHQRERHDASLCTYCGVFEWGRPYRLREHLEDEHPDVNVEAALEEATRTRRRATSSTSPRGD